MNQFIASSAFLSVLISLGAYFLGLLVKRKLKLAIFNPLLIAVLATIIFLVITRTSYETYRKGSRFLDWLLTPATVALAIPLYEQLEMLKRNWKAVLLGVASGMITSILSVLAICFLFHLPHEYYVSFLPKSVTTAIGMVLSQEMGGYVPITVSVIVMTGIVGNIVSPFVLKIGRINDPVAKGIAIGTSSHVIGTSKAMEMGEVEGAFSSISLVISGIMTVLGSMFVKNLI
ncbi:MAG: LrgB family protein [Sphaerochaetaceae bacterium]|jgi:predicted murein hydrolase (TIGR00659 family)|nr:LrgB family protein [Sphaerochaetaceae bacterium]